MRYGADVAATSEAICTAAEYPWSVWLHALIPHWLPWARRRLRLTPSLEAVLRQMSPARWIGGSVEKSASCPGAYGRTKPSTLREHHIPLQTERWNVTEPGFTEIDWVSHSGDRADGEFIHSLNVTDIHITWVETREEESGNPIHGAMMPRSVTLGRRSCEMDAPANPCRLSHDLRDVELGRRDQTFVAIYASAAAEPQA